jgi:tetratricopeptide (TPR) repeat protein
MGTNAFRDKVRYYESNRTQIHYLSYEERIDVELDYLLCLFEIGKYHKFLSKANSLIEAVIIDNIFVYNGLNIYNDLLFKKAACFYNTGQYKKSEKVLKAILKLDLKNDSARMLFSKCKRKRGRDWYEATKAIAILMFISAFTIAFAELFVIKPFYSELLPSFIMLKFTSFILGLIALLGNELYLRYVIGKEIGYTFDWKKIKDKLPF